jgi:hypothetical protein
MTAVAVIIRDALSHLKVVDATEAPEAYQLEDAMRALNLMVTRWEASGIALGWVDVTDPDGDLPAPAEAEEALGFNLALKLAPRYGVQPGADVVEFARAGKAALMADIASRDAARLCYDLPAASTARVGDFYTGAG